MKPVSSLPGEFHVSKTNGGMGPKSLTVNGRGVGRFHIICKLWSVCSSLSRNCKHLVPGAMAVKPAFFVWISYPGSDFGIGRRRPFGQ